MSTEEKTVVTEKIEVSPDSMKLEENAAASPVSPSKRDLLPFSTNDNDDDDDDAEEVDSEEDFLQHMEQETAEKESTADNHQSSNAKDAPRLLQDALKKGDVDPDDSSGEEEKKDAKEEDDDTKSPAEEKKSAAVGAKEEIPDEHVQQRVSQLIQVFASSFHDTIRSYLLCFACTRAIVHSTYCICFSSFLTSSRSQIQLVISMVINHQASQLDFLLSKASEYSNFIAADLQELQEQMAEDARRKLESSSKKRKKGATGKNKKGKNSEGEANLRSAQDKYSETKTGGNARPIFAQPSLLAKGCILKDYQLEGVRWLTSLFENGVSGILADEMGLGKTIQVIAMVAHLKSMNVPGPFLIVAPLATLPNWVREFEKWLPSLPVVRYHGAAADREHMLQTVLNPKNKRQPDFPAIITSYEVAIKDEKKLNKIGEFTHLVVDEGQRLKNHRCTLIQSLKRVKAANRLLLSGTPIQNNLDECKSYIFQIRTNWFTHVSHSYWPFLNAGFHYRSQYQYLFHYHHLLFPFSVVVAQFCQPSDF